MDGMKWGNFWNGNGDENWTIDYARNCGHSRGTELPSDLRKNLENILGELNCLKRYEYRDDSGNWFRAYGNENWEFEANGLMKTRIASINDLAIAERERKFHWPQGRRPDNHAGLSEMELWLMDIILVEKCKISKNNIFMRPYNLTKLKISNLPSLALKPKPN